VISVAFRTLPSSIRQLKRIIDVSTVMTAFGGRKEAVYLNDTAAVPLTFIFQHIHKRIPPTVADRLSKTMVLKHVLDGKTLYVDCLVLADKFSACLMKEILPLIRNLFMLTCKSYDCSSSVVRTLLFSGNMLLKTFKSLFGLSQKLRRINNSGVRSGDERLYTVVNTDLRPRSKLDQVFPIHRG